MTDVSTVPPLPEALPIPVIDAHTHLAATAERDGLSTDELIERAAQVGVVRMVDVGTDVESSELALQMAASHPSVLACVALHPNDAARLGEGLDDALTELGGLIDTGFTSGTGSSADPDRQASEHDGGVTVPIPRVAGIGETGLDYYRTTSPADRLRQKDAFAAHIAWAKQYDLPLVIHDRDAHDDVLDVLDAEGAPALVMMHCFSGDADLARRCFERGFYLSFNGTITFKPNEHLREALDIAPLDRILIETDAPYLTPMPYRGKPNASYLIPLTIRFMAERRQTPVEELCAMLYANAVSFFGADGWSDAQ